MATLKAGTAATTAAKPGANPAAKAQAAPAPDSPWLRWRPHHLAIVFSLLALAGHGAVWRLAAPWGQLPAPGAAVATLALAWVLWAQAALRRQPWVTQPQPQPRALMDEGPFRFTRNPMALGTAGVMLGCALILGAPFLALAALAWLTLLNRLHIPHEEAQLQRAFGAWYSDYAASVRRWL